MELKEEMNTLMKVSLFAYISLGYCFFIPKLVPKGFPRLLTILPVVLLFLSIPLSFNSVHFIGPISFFLSWLANFKLLLFAFGKGPLSAPSIPLSRFLALACFPIKLNNNHNLKKPPLNTTQKSFFNYAIKAVLLTVFLQVYYDQKDIMNPMVAWCLFGPSIYFFLELLLVSSSVTVGSCLKVELDPQFDEPYLATSLQDFWGRRWNVMVSRILHPTIYEPILKLSIPAVGRMWAPVPAILTTFAVSGLMHELIFFYFTRAWPSWEVMFFFCLHGVCLVVEILIKKAVNVKWSLPRQLTAPLIVSFVLATSYWLFRPELSRCKIIERAFEEYGAVNELAKEVVWIPHVHLVSYMYLEE